MHYLRLWDESSSRRVDGFIANSRFVARRIRKVYGRGSRVVHPPVDVESFTRRDDKDDFYLAASRLVPYKRVDLVVEAFNAMPSRRLVVIGGGGDEKRLRSIAGPNVTILGHQPGEVLRDHMQRARAFVFAAQEDFGIAVVEAQACGTPAICFGKGGATESVVDGETGLFFDEQSPGSIIEAVDRFEAHADDFSPIAIRENAERFGHDRFRAKYAAVIDRAWRDFERGMLPGRRRSRRKTREFNHR
jgi:glycosyltransferase involved in cell wall biosynthesis